jgi:ribosomal protein S18 acetylase RimI-like enzyme
MRSQDWVLRRAAPEDLPSLQAVRAAAFAPVFESFRVLLGDEVAVVTQVDADQKQADYLTTLLDDGGPWEVFAAERSDEIVGFVSLRLDPDTAIGEIGLNAVHPEHGGRGIGTAMYELALDRMRAAGMKVATVSAGADASHAPALRAYEKAGFTVGIPSIWLCSRLDAR